MSTADKPLVDGCTIQVTIPEKSTNSFLANHRTKVSKLAELLAYQQNKCTISYMNICVSESCVLDIRKCVLDAHT